MKKRTALQSETIVSSCLASGADGYIVKPFNPQGIKESGKNFCLQPEKGSS